MSQQNNRCLGEFTTDQESKATILNKNEERREKFKRIEQESYARIVWDKDWGGVQVSPWGIRKSDGYECQQIITQRGPSKLERRSEESGK